MPTRDDPLQDYVFVSYAHADAERVLPDIEIVQKHGHPVWSDHQIGGGVVWRDTIAQKISKSSFVLAYLSKNWLQSEYCQQEVSFALDEGKTILCVYLEDFALTPGLKLSLGRRQALLRHQADPNDYVLKLVAAIDSNQKSEASSLGGGETQYSPDSLLLHYQTEVFTIPSDFGGLFSIGRSTQCQLTLPVRFASRFHGTIRVAKNRFVYEDESSNGTILVTPVREDGEEVGSTETLVQVSKVELPESGELRIGGETIRFTHSRPR